MSGSREVPVYERDREAVGMFQNLILRDSKDERYFRYLPYAYFGLGRSLMRMAEGLVGLEKIEKLQYADYALDYFLEMSREGSFDASYTNKDVARAKRLRAKIRKLQPINPYSD